MAYLDANALHEDPVGMAFLARALDLPVDIPAVGLVPVKDEIVRVREPAARPLARTDKRRGDRRPRRPVFEAA